MELNNGQGSCGDPGTSGTCAGVPPVSLLRARLPLALGSCLQMIPRPSRPIPLRKENDMHRVLEIRSKLGS